MLIILVILYVTAGVIMADAMKAAIEVPMSFALCIGVPFWPYIIFARLVYLAIYKIMGEI